MVLPHGNNNVPPYHLATHLPADLSRLRTFGCAIYALSTKKCVGKLTMENVTKGIFLGYGASMETFMYESTHTHRICRATHATFDEAQLDSLPQDMSPNSKALCSALSHQPESKLDPLDTILTPPRKFLCLRRILVFHSHPRSARRGPMCFLSFGPKFSSAAKIEWEHDLRYRTIIQVDATPVFLSKDVHRALASVDVATHDSVRLVVADYKADPQSEPAPIPQITMEQMRAIHHILHGWDLSEPVLRVTPVAATVSIVIADNAATMATGQTHTRRTCLNGPHREKWVDTEFSQLDKHNSYGMYGKPLPRSAVHSSGTVVHLIWNYSQKGSGTFKARECMNRKQLVRMGHTFEHTYTASMEQHCFWLFIAFAAPLGVLIEDGDVVNAYAHKDTEGPTIYLSVDDVYQAWYLEHFLVDLSLGSCVPLLKAMQRHPEA
jgi:hypothetical protein